MKKITLKKLLFLNNVVIIDIREKDEFLNHCIPNSINIPFFELSQNYAKYINKDIKYYIYIIVVIFFIGSFSVCAVVLFKLNEKYVVTPTNNISIK